MVDDKQPREISEQEYNRILAEQVESLEKLQPRFQIFGNAIAHSLGTKDFALSPPENASKTKVPDFRISLYMPDDPDVPNSAILNNEKLVKLKDAFQKTGVQTDRIIGDTSLNVLDIPITTAAALVDKIGADEKFIESPAAPAEKVQAPAAAEKPLTRQQQLEQQIAALQAQLAEEKKKNATPEKLAEPTKLATEKPAPQFDGAVRYDYVKALSKKYPKNEVLQSLVGKIAHRGDLHLSQLEPREQRVMEAILVKDKASQHPVPMAEAKTQATPVEQPQNTPPATTPSPDSQKLEAAAAAFKKLARQNYLGGDVDNELSAGDVIVQLGMDRNWDTKHKNDETTKIHQEVQQQMDLNDDGKVTKEEFEKVRAAAKRAGVTMDNAAATEFMKVINIPHNNTPSKTQQTI